MQSNWAIRPQTATPRSIYEPSFARVPGGIERDDSLTFIAALTYSVAPNAFLGGEIRHENLARDGSFQAHALYVGPSLFYRITKDLSVKGAWAAQIPDIGASSLDLSTYVRHQFEIEVAYSF